MSRRIGRRPSWGRILIPGLILGAAALGHGGLPGGQSMPPPDGSGVRSLFNGRDLTGWDRYLGVAEVPTIPFDPFGFWPEPIGLNHDPGGVFSVVSEDGEPAIRISGEHWGALITQGEFGNYHLSLEYKWGRDRHPPREDAARNTGLLYHSVGPHGAFWSYWMRSAEFEIMEGSTGDFTAVDGIRARGSTEWDLSAGYPWVRDSPTGTPTTIAGALFRVAARDDFEKPRGWNRLDLRVSGDAAVHIVNGQVVLRVEGLQQEVGGRMVPLKRGAIQLQSEGAEVFFRHLQLRPIDAQPSRSPPATLGRAAPPDPS